MMLPEWMADALCAEVDTDVFFPGHGGTATAARSICRRCPVTVQCLAYALEAEQDEWGRTIGGRHGVYGGFTPSERTKMSRGAA